MGHDITLQTTNGKKFLYWIRFGCDVYPDLYKIMGVERECGEVDFTREQIESFINVFKKDEEKYWQELEMLSKAEGFYNKEGIITIIFE
jgi:hypothetical protein